MCRKNRCHACHPRVVRFRHWAWYEWLTAVFLIIALIYSIYGIVSTSIEIVRLKYSLEKKYIKDLTAAKIIIRPSVSVTILAILMAAHWLLLVTSILGLLWLKYLRNMCIFLATFVLLVIAIIFYFLTGGVIEYTMDNKNGLKSDVYLHMYRNMPLTSYALSFRAYQRENSCCGVYNYRDWSNFSKVDGMNNPADSVPDSCCPTSMNMENCGSKMLNEPPASKKLIAISKRGCFDDLLKEYIPVYREYAIEVFVVAFLLIGLLLLLLYICHRLYLQLVRPRYYNEDDGGAGDTDTYRSANNNQDNATTLEVDADSSTGPRRQQRTATGVTFSTSSRKGRRNRRGRDRDDDRESYMIPGTPAKSMISDDEQTFYAP